MKRIFYIHILFIGFVLLATTATAQRTDRDYIRMGNKNYHRGEFDKALTNFTKALEKNKTVEAFYNFAGAALVQGQDSTALDAYQKAEEQGFVNPLKRAKNFHNMGNVWYMYGIQQMRSNGQNAGTAFQNAVNLYKSSLRCNPNDDETRYNLAMAQYMLKNGKNGGGGGNDNKDKEQQDKEKQEQQKQQQKQQQDKQDQKDQMSDEAAEQLLNSAQQDEKDVQRKVKVNPTRRKSLEKDW